MMQLFKRWQQRRHDRATLIRSVDTLKENEQDMQNLLGALVEQRLREMPPEEALRAIKRFRGEA